MADDEAPAKRLLIVTGSTLRAEDVDRPLAYYLKQRIEKPSPSEGDDASTAESFRIHVVADFRWIHDEPLQSVPTISIGGPGVNALAHRWLEDLPVAPAVDGRYGIPMDPALEEPRVSIWGMDNATTQIAVSVFIERFMPRFLQNCPEGASNASDLDVDDTD